MQLCAHGEAADRSGCLGRVRGDCRQTVAAAGSAPVADHLAACDVMTFWTWKAEELARLEANFRRTEELAPTTRKVLGCYMWD